jgi:23S rRNA (cytosine1962-C5)-methyltransferase
MNSKTKTQISWRLRKGMDRRFRTGHPWVYSNEIIGGPQGIEPGEIVELQDAGGQFLARGFGNPSSLISFRALSRDAGVVDPVSGAQLLALLIQAHGLRVQAGFSGVSHRLCFGESDGLPGLIIDRYRVRQGQVFVVQAHTAGADRLLPRLFEGFQTFVEQTQSGQGGRSVEWRNTAVVLRNDVAVRKLEGLPEKESCEIVKGIPEIELQDCEIAVRSVVDAEPLWFRVDLREGQKTGFFLDQFSNIQIAAQSFKTFEFGRARPHAGSDSAPIRILDLCCYVGQWSAQLAAVLTRTGRKVEVLAVDVSERALELARHNIEAQGAQCEVLKAHVLKELGDLPARGFDLVISDPPALIKGRKDIPVGTHAYLQLATQVFKWVRPGGGVVCCSCSAWLEEESFIQAQSKGIQRNRRQVQWISRGSQAPDHPVLAEFPEGRYLKAWIGAVRV